MLVVIYGDLASWFYRFLRYNEQPAGSFHKWTVLIAAFKCKQCLLISFVCYCTKFIIERFINNRVRVKNFLRHPEIFVNFKIYWVILSVWQPINNNIQKKTRKFLLNINEPVIDETTEKKKYMYKKTELYYYIYK